MIIATPVTPDGNVDPRWGRAHTMALAQVENDELVGWSEVEVNWDVLHDEGTEGSHHARVVTFLRENSVEGVILYRAGEPMLNTMAKMGLVIATDAAGNAKDIVAGTAPMIREILEQDGSYEGFGSGGGCGGGGCGCGGGGCGCGGH